MRKPFFLTKICDIFMEGGDIDPSGDITRQVVEAALGREASKLSDARGKELLTRDQHRVFCEALADEMWALGAPELDCDSIRLLAELIAEQFRLDARDTKTLVDRSIAHGLLSVVPGRVPEKRAFEHELFRFEFQAGSLAKLLNAGSDSGRDYVRRAELPIEIVSRVALFGLNQPDTISKILASLSEIVASAPNNQFSATNAGSIAWALMRNQADLPKGLRLFGFYLRAHDFGDCRIEQAAISGCVFERVNLSNTKLLHCVVEGTLFIGCTIGEQTRLTGTQVKLDQISGIVSQDSSKKSVEVYDPARVYALLKDADASVQDADAYQDAKALTSLEMERVTVVERLLAHARNHFYLSRIDPWFQNNLANSTAWTAVEPLLKKKGLLEEVSLDKSGRPESFLRLSAAPDKILQARSGLREGIPSAAVEFWRELLQ